MHDTENINTTDNPVDPDHPNMLINENQIVMVDGEQQQYKASGISEEMEVYLTNLVAMSQCTWCSFGQRSICKMNIIRVQPASLSGFKHFEFARVPHALYLIHT